MRPAGSTLPGLTRLLNSQGRPLGLHSGSAAHYICSLSLLLSFPKRQLSLRNGKGQYQFMVSMRRWNVMSPSPAAAFSTSTNAVPKKKKLQGPYLYDMRHTQGSKSSALDKTNTAVCFPASSHSLRPCLRFWLCLFQDSFKNHSAKKWSQNCKKMWRCPCSLHTITEKNEASTVIFIL